MALLKKTKHNFESWRPPLTKMEGKSKTIPNESLTIKEIINRHATGRPVPVNTRMKWIDGDLPPRLEDLTDIDTAKQMIADLEAKIAEEKEFIEKKETEILEENSKENPTEPTQE